MTKSLVNSKLTDLIQTDAKLAMPDIVAIFLSQYETKLFDRKTELNKSLSKVTKEIKDYEKEVAATMNYSKYLKIKVPEFNLVAELESGPNVMWGDSLIQVEIRLIKDTAKKRPSWYSNPPRGFSDTFTSPISKPVLSKFKRLCDKKEELTNQLGEILNKITDISRKERQVKARISEMRLKESGMQEFVNNSEMLQLIQID